MTREEALKIATSSNPLLKGSTNCSEYVKCIIEALEKQVPKKPTLNDRDDAWKCPCCGEEDYMPFHMYKFCPNCGQAIEWDESN